LGSGAGTSSVGGGNGAGGDSTALAPVMGPMEEIEILERVMIAFKESVDQAMWGGESRGRSE